MTKFKRIVEVALKHIEYTKLMTYYAKKTKTGLFNAATFKLPLDYTAFINNLTPKHLQELNDYLDQELEYYYMESNNGN